MPTPERMNEPNNLEYLDTDWKLATVYTAFLFPKSQQDAIRLIYKKNKGIGGKAPIIKHPVNWIIDAREELMEKGYLVRTDNKLKNSIIKADVEPIITSLIEAGAKTGPAPAPAPAPEIIEGTRRVLDSNWFRKFFSYEYLYNPITYRNKSVYEPYLETIKHTPSGDRLEIKSLKNRLFQLLYEIGYYSHNIRWLMDDIQREQRESIVGSDDPILKDLLASQNLEELIDNNRSGIPPHFIEIYYYCITNTDMNPMNNYYPEKFLKHLVYSHAGSFIPMQVSIFLRSAPYTSSVRPLDCGYIMKIFHHDWRRLEHVQSEPEGPVLVKK
ncbi:MAG: hypothetical protein WCK53_09830 [Methanomicrobiales archaeon]